MSALYLLIVLWCDLRTRRYPFWLLGLGLLFGLAEGWSWWGMGLGLVLGGIADLPGGDLKFVGVFGGLVGVEIIAWTVFLAFCLTVLAWIRGLTGVPGTIYMGLGYSWTVIFQTIFQPSS